MNTWQQYVMAGLMTLQLIVGMWQLYGEPNGREAFTRVIAICLGVVLPVWALYSAGFWS